MKAIETQPGVLASPRPRFHWSSYTPSTEATTTWQTHMPIAPTIRNVFRPKLSRNKTDGSVKMICRIPVTPVANRLVVTELKPKLENICGA
jgi:hypothetical protein